MSGPKFLFPSVFHIALTLGTGLSIPQTDVVATTLQTQTADLTSIWRRHICNDTTNHDVLDGLAVRAWHRCNLLTEQSPPLIHLSLISTALTAIFPFPRHCPMIVVVIVFCMQKYHKKLRTPNFSHYFWLSIIAVNQRTRPVILQHVSHLSLWHRIAWQFGDFLWS